jgi:hypothetical protein
VVRIRDVATAIGGFGAGLGQVHQDARQVEHRRHPGNHEQHVQ